MLRRFWNNWTTFARSMGDYQSRMLLTLLYFVVVSPFGVATRAFGNSLNLGVAHKSSYWLARSESALSSLDASRRQY